jgi:transposase-like protein
MVAAVRAGESRRSVARRFGVALSTVQAWLIRAGEERLDRVDWSDRPAVPHHVRRTEAALEERILVVRRLLREESILGEYGAAAIRRELLEDATLPWPVPTARTIGRILERRGALDGRRRVRRPPPPPGWYLPDVAARRVELDSFDIIDGLRLRGGLHLDILTGISLHGGLPVAWPEAGMSATKAVAAFTGHWRETGLPGYAQFDNDGRFIGGHAKPDSIGPVIRLCLALGVVPVFAPPRESGFQAAIEAFNGRWQAKLWARFWEPDLRALQVRSDLWIGALRRRSAVRIEAAPERAPFPLVVDAEPDLRQAPAGRLVFLRRTDDQGTASVLERRYPVHTAWLHRLVRAELDLDTRRLRFYALRRRAPEDQPILAEREYNPPARWFR